MRFFNKSFVLLCVLGVLCGSGFAVDREAFSFRRYDLQVQLDPELHLLNAKGIILLRNDSKEPQRNVVLQISSQLNWASIEAKNANGEWSRVQYVGAEYTTDIDRAGSLTEAILSLPQAVAPGADMEVRVAYAGEITPIATRLTRIGTPAETAARNDWDRIEKSFTALRGVGFVAWYPTAVDAVSLSEGNTVQEALARWKERERGAQLHSEICLPTAAAYPTFIANAAPEMHVVDSRCATLNFDLGADVPVFVLGPLHTLEGAARLSYLPADTAPARDFNVSSTTAQTLISEWLPVRGKAELIDLPFEAMPFEAGTLRFMPIRNQGTKTRELHLVHAMTHAAFPATRPWLREGMANFMQAMLRERQENRAAALEILSREDGFLFGLESQNSATPELAAANSLINTPDQIYYGEKSARVLWMLRDMLGDASLKAALTQYDPAQDTHADYFQKLLQSSSKKDLEWFFDDWVYRDRGLPDFRVVSVSTRELLGGSTKNAEGRSYLATVTLENLGGAGAEVPVTVAAGDRKLTQRVIVKAHDKAFVRMDVPFLPQTVTVNDGSVPEAVTSNNIYDVPAASAPKP